MKKNLAVFLCFFWTTLSAFALAVNDGTTGVNCEKWDSASNTAWTNQGGDWEDANGTAQGSNPFKTADLQDTNNVRGIAFDVTNMVKDWGSDNGLYRGFIIRNGDENSALYSSREGPYPPRLVIYYADNSSTNYYPSADSQITCPGTTFFGQSTSMVLDSSSNILLAFDNVPRRTNVTSAKLLLTSIVQFGRTEADLYQLVEGGVGGSGAPGDGTAPTLSSSTPSDNATGVSVSNDLTLNFSETVSAGTGLVGLYKQSDNSLVESFNVATLAGSAGGAISFASAAVTINPNANLDYSTAYYVQVATTAVKDGAGNYYAGITNTTTLNFTTGAAPDVTAPTLSSSVPADEDTGVAVGANVALNFSETVQAGTGNIVIKKSSDNSTVESFNVATGVGTAGGAATFSGSVVTINPFFDLANSTAYYVQVDSTAVKDGSNNTYAGIANTTTLNFETAAPADVTNPTLSSSDPADEEANVAITDNVNLTFSETVVAGTGNITLKKTADDSTIESFNVATGAGSGGGTVTFNSTALVVVNPAAVLANSTGYYITIDATAVDDAASNSYAGISDKTVLNFTTIAAPDTTPPTLTLSSPTDEEINVPTNTNVVLTFSETVQAGSGNVYIKKDSDDSTVESFDVATGVGSATGTLTFNGGTGITINPFADLLNTTTYYVTIDNTAVTDQASNAYAGISAKTTLNFSTVEPPDSTAPTLTSSTPADNATGVSVSNNFTLNFSEPIRPGTGNVVLYKQGDILVESFSVATGVGSAGGAISFSGSAVTINPAANLDSATGYYLKVDNTAVEDIAGNAYAGISTTTALNFTSADVVAPTLSASTPADNATGVSTSANQTFTFSEIVQSDLGYFRLYKSGGILVEEFDTAIGLGNQGGTLSFSNVTGVTIITINPFAPLLTNTDYYFLITSDAVKDAAGNFYAGISDSTTLNFSTSVSDTTPPTVDIASDRSALKIGETATLTFTFSEDIEDASFNDADITVESGTKGTLTKVTETSYTMVYTPDAATTDASMVVSIGTSAFRDVALNNNAVGDTLPIAVDTARPTIASFVSSDSSLISGETATLTVTFSEDVGTSFAIGDITVDPTYGALDLFNKSSPTVYTVRFTPASGVNTAATAVSIAGTGYQDVAGNAGTGTSSLNLAVDTRALTATIDSSLQSLRAVDTATLTFTFSQDLDDETFTLDDIIAESGNVSGLTKSTETVYTATYTPAASVSDSSMVITLVGATIQDLAGNTNGEATKAIAVDTVYPTLTITTSDDTITSGEVAVLTFTFSEPVLNFVVGDITIPGGAGTIGSFSGSGASYTATYTPTVSYTNPTMTVSVASGTFNDVNGNIAQAGNSVNLNVDTSTTPQTQEAANWQRMYDGSTGVTREYWNADLHWRWKRWENNTSVSDSADPNVAGLGDWSDATGTMYGTALTATGVAFPSQSVSGVGVTINLNVTDIVEQWMGDPQKYKGIMLRRQSGSGTIYFNSREATSNTPLLTINYTDGTVLNIGPDADSTVDQATGVPQGTNNRLKVQAQNSALSFWTGVTRKPINSANLRLTTASGTTSSAAVVAAYQLEQPDPGLNQTTHTTTVTCPGGSTATRAGIAACFTNDVSIETHPDVYVAERFDSTTWYARTQNGSNVWTPNNNNNYVDNAYTTTGETGFASVTAGTGRAHGGYFTGDGAGTAATVRLAYMGHYLKKAAWTNSPPAAPQELYFRYYLRPMGTDTSRPFLALGDGGKFPGFTWSGQDSAGSCGNGGDTCVTAGSGWSARGGFYTTTDASNPAYGRLKLDTYYYTKDLFQRHISWQTYGIAAVPIGEWSCVEQYIKLNTNGQNNGIQRAWINGKLVYEKTNLKFVSDTAGTTQYPTDAVWSNFYHGGTSEPLHDAGSWHDNFVVAKSYIGCIPGTF